MKHLKLFLIACLVMSAIFESIAQKTDSLKGKKFGVIGDSYVRNHREQIENTWHYKFAVKHGMEYFNYGKNGNCITVDLERWGKSICHRYADMNDSLDYVVVIAGHNDSGRLDSIGIDVFKQRLNSLCQGLIDKYPAAQIFFFTPWTCENFETSNRKKVVDAMVEVCENWGIPIFDAARRSGIYCASQKFRAIYFQGRNGKDGAHLNAKGHDRFLPIAEHFLLQYINR